jgi:hypothetical protein
MEQEGNSWILWEGNSRILWGRITALRLERYYKILHVLHEEEEAKAA